MDRHGSPAGATAPGPDPHRLAESLVWGARRELDLTPKPGLVDLHDSGSHPDLDHARMARSIELLPAYFRELIDLARSGVPLADCIAAGRRAESRMQDAAGSNTHRGYIFLSGLMLLGACDRDRPLREAIMAVAREFFAGDGRHGPERPGERIRGVHGIGGVRTEALRGLPSVFEVGLPAYRSAGRPPLVRPPGRLPASPAGADLAAFRAMAALMQVVEDTTAVQRCGLGGLARLRRDGATLQALLDRGEDPVPLLTAWGEEYRATRLTMGGVADCLALVLALAGNRDRPARNPV